jgi:hypothetical protein
MEIVSDSDLALYKVCYPSPDRDISPKMYPENYNIQNVKEYVIDTLKRMRFHQSYTYVHQPNIYTFDDLEKFAQNYLDVELLQSLDSDLSTINRCVTEYFRVYRLINKGDATVGVLHIHPRPIFIQVAVPYMIAVKTKEAQDLLNFTKEDLIRNISHRSLTYLNVETMHERYRMMFRPSDVEIVFKKDTSILFDPPIPEIKKRWKQEPNEVYRGLDLFHLEFSDIE